MAALAGHQSLSFRLFATGQVLTVDAPELTLGAPVRVPADPVALEARAPAGHQVAAALPGLAAQGIEVGEFSFGQPSLDEVFLALTGHPGAGEKTPEVTT